MTPSWASLLWFAAILVAIPAVLWFLKRTPLGGAATGGAGTPRSVAVLPLSAQQRLVTVEVGQGEDRQWLVLGVTPQGITTLHTMAPQAQGAGSADRPQAAFAQLLHRLRQNGSAPDAR
ncbi:MAG TPA: flagellar biosynthetic protein FliO [Rubrivivax sp.]|nr:flagellar biosynthetic protein FliO [Rubrivivax sp.]